MIDKSVRTGSFGAEIACLFNTLASSPSYIGTYTISNCMSLIIYDIDDAEEVVVVGRSDEDDSEELKLEYVDDEYGFYWGDLFVPLSEVERVD